MPTFLENCNCKGARPNGIVGLKHNLRPSVTGRLLNDRHCARYIVAPGGYGKSSIAYEYAQIVFEFEHVFWVRCDSPCFIRDLDDGRLTASIFKIDANARLIVFDDVPQLDYERTQIFGEVIDEILEKDCEVIACCTPANDTISSLRPNCVQIRPKDLLLTDEEVEIERLRGNVVADFDSFGNQWRTASFVWSEGKKEGLVSGVAQEKLPMSLKSAIFAMLVLGEGTIDELSRLLRPSLLEEDMAYLEDDYPYLGLDINNGTFQAFRLDISDLVKCMGGDICSLCAGFLPEITSDLASVLADELIDVGSCGRGAEFMKAYGRGESRQAWTLRNGWSMAFNPDPLPYLKLVEDCLEKSGKQHSDVYTVSAWSSYILGDEKTAMSYCKKAARTNSKLWQEKDACRLLSMMINGDKSDVLPIIDGGRADICFVDAETQRAMASLIDSPMDWSLACDLFEAMHDGNDEFIDLWKNDYRSPDSDSIDSFKLRTLVFSGVMFIQKLMGDGLDDESDEKVWEAIDLISECFISLIDGASAQDMGWPEYLAVKVIEQCCDRFPFRISGTLRVSDIAVMRKIDMCIFEQASEWRNMSEESKRLKGEFELTHPNSFRKNAMKATELSSLRASTPTLSISLFGGLSCCIGGGEGDVIVLSREKAKSLLAIIALNHGREVSRERLVRSIWPDSNYDAANKNLYVVWSYLRRSLSIGGTCPYLLRTQNGFRLDMRYVSCDLSDYEELCRTLLFGHEGMVVWEEVYEKVSRRFSEDLLPCITNNQAIESARKMYRDQLVDGLVAASNRLYGQNEVRGATWYAREAKRRDPSREDVYIALMSAQIASDQRACALDTYFECRKFLSETMGIDPSAKVMDLYRSIIEEEHDF